MEIYKMNNLKIIVCSTFRDFKGTENDEIQKVFLKSLENQTYKNFEIVVTLFGEKNVQNEVEKFKFDSYFYDSVVDSNYRYSLTKVLLNTIEHANKKYDDYIIFWTTCDVIYDSNFFETIINNYNTNTIGTSHPHATFSSLMKFEHKEENKNGKLFSGFDLIYFDKEFLENPKVKSSIEKYVFNDWGVFEHFLIALNEFSNNLNMINIYEQSKINKIENDRELTNEPNQFLINSHKLNSIVFNTFFSENKISNEYFDLTYCHLKFNITIKKLNHYCKFSNDIFEYIKRKTRRIIVSLIPNNIKTIIKKGIKK